MSFVGINRTIVHGGVVTDRDKISPFYFDVPKSAIIPDEGGGGTNTGCSVYADTEGFMNPEFFLTGFSIKVLEYTSSEVVVELRFDKLYAAGQNDDWEMIAPYVEISGYMYVDYSISGSNGEVIKLQHSELIELSTRGGTYTMTMSGDDVYDSDTIEVMLSPCDSGHGGTLAYAAIKNPTNEELEYLYTESVANFKNGYRGADVAV